MGSATSTVRPAGSPALAAAAAPAPGRVSSQKAFKEAPRRRSTLTLPTGALSPHSATDVMADIVADANERKLFEAFLDGEFCPEILRFWKATEAYGRQALKLALVKAASQPEVVVASIELGHPHLVSKARAIVDAYLAPGCAAPVNVSAKCARQITLDVDLHTPAPL